MKKNIIIAALALLVMGSCKTLRTEYERPEVNTKGLVRDPSSLTDTLVSSNQATFGQLPWRSVFTDPQLQALIQQALANNADLLNAALSVKMVEEQVRMARLAFLPGISFTPQGTISSWDYGKATKSYQLPITASWNADLFGTLLNQKRSAQATLLATKDYQVAVQTNVVCGVANLYYTLLMLDRQMEILDDMSQLTQDTWDKMKIMKDNRIGYRSTAVQSAEANHLSVQAQKAELKRQIREMENSMSVLIGQPAQTIKRGKLEAQSLPQNFSAGVGIQLLNNRADVHAAEMKLAQCFYDINTARSRFYPSITISGTGAFTNQNGLVNPGKMLWSAVGSLVQPIFQKGQLTGGLRVAEMQYEQAYNSWQATVLKAGSEVSNALVLYNSSAEKSDIEAQQIEVLKKNVEDTKALMASSGSTYLEVIQAQSSLLSTQLSKVADDFYKMQAVVNLYQALGGGGGE
ncbi:MAG: efflux transporter outer membrane subunit [Prevotella sp.]|nr:efflux transporter outer membrane subunit [Prevotella sp.]